MLGMKPETAIETTLSGKEAGQTWNILRELCLYPQNLKSVDETISRLTVGWTLDRMGAVDRNLLRLASMRSIP